MANYWKTINNKQTFEDPDLAAPVTLKELAQGANAAHHARHENGGADEIDATGLTGIPDTSTLIANALIAAKGDLIVGTANDTPAIQSIGSNGQHLVANSAVTNGLQWDTSPCRENLLINSAFKDTNEDGVPDWWALLVTPTLAIAADTLCGFNDSHNQITITGAGAANEGIKIQGAVANWLKVRPSTTYVFSMYYKVTAGDTLSVHIHSYNGATEGTAHVTVTNLGSTTAVRYEVSFTTDADATNLHIELKATADGDICVVSHPKFEIGSIATSYCTSNKLKQISWGALAFNLDFATAVPASLTEVNGDADQVPVKSVAFSKSDCAWLAPEFDVPITYNGGSVLLSYRFYALAASKTHTMELAFVSRGLSDAMNGAVGGFTSLGADVADGTTSDEQINEIMLTQAQIGFVAGEEIALYLRRENSGDADEVYIKSLKIQYIEV